MVFSGTGLKSQEQIAASHEFDGVRKEKERLTAASLNKARQGITSVTRRYRRSLLETHSSGD